jgi:hypothetical protein
MEKRKTPTVTKSMKAATWRNVTRQHHEGLARGILTRADLLKLASTTDRDLTPYTLAMIIGENDERPNGNKTAADYLNKATAILDPTKDHNEVLKLNQRQRAAIVSVF